MSRSYPRGGGKPSTRPTVNPVSIGSMKMTDDPQIVLVVAGKPYLDITAQLGELYLDSGEPETGVMILDRPYGSVLNIPRQSHTLDVEVLQTGMVGGDGPMSIPAITEDLEDAMRREGAGTTPVEIAQARIDIAMCKWAMAHDTAEAFYGDPDWYARRRP